MVHGRLHDREKQLGRWVLQEVLLLRWWQSLQESVETWRWRRVLLVSSLVLGLGARLWAQSLPGNWDFGQWVNVSTAVLKGQDPYALFAYNYPPPWLLVLTTFNAATSSDEAFRLSIALLLAAADVGTALILAKKGYLLAACVFLLSPITIAISGQHQQVEGIAVFLALAAVAVMPGKIEVRPSGRDWLVVLLLGMSLSFKPIFLLLPLWLAYRQRSWTMRAFYFVIPVIVFGGAVASAFIAFPYRTVLQKTLGYSGANNSPFINTFVPEQLAPWVLDHGGGKVVFLVILAAAGWYFRRRSPFELALIYTVTALVFSWAMVNQYLATPVAAVAIYLNVGLLVWFLLASVYLGGDPGVLGIPGLTAIQQNTLLEWMRVMQDLFPWLLIGWIILTWQANKPNGLFRPNTVSGRRSDTARGPSRS